MMTTNRFVGILLVSALTVMGANKDGARTAEYSSVASLLERAHKLAAAPRTARVPLLDGATEPSFVRAMALTPNAAAPMRDLFEAVVDHGALPSEYKLAMAMRIAQIYSSPYLAAHASRRLRATNDGRAVLALFDRGAALGSTAPAIAISYAGKLTRGVHGVSNEDFRLVRSQFNDSQIVELTTTTCFFNYLVRFVEALRLPVEPWALEPATAGESQVKLPVARVSLISDEEIEALEARIKAQSANTTTNNWNIGFANSMRAMLLSPAAASAWMKYGNATREYATVDRTLKLHISFAVSMANGCRYCTLHQVLGLRRQGVEIAKLAAMEKDDSALSPRELTAVRFARKLTTNPAGISNQDYEGLEKEFGKPGALEVVQQTCTFAFMNRFTDGLRLPSEDEAVRVYLETYGRRFHELP